jgi:hypothetical protein
MPFTMMGRRRMGGTGSGQDSDELLKRRNYLFDKKGE